jgi:hypothetical protein
VIALVGAWLLAAACPAPAPLPETRGRAEVVRLPAAAAMDLNREGKLLYKQGRFAEARARYTAALAADPEFLGPALNLACAYSRQENYARAAHEAISLVRRAYVPGAREVMEAADLGILQIRPEGKVLRAALAEAAAEWGHALGGSVLFVARTRPPIRLHGEGVLVLGMNQEVFAWVPETGRYLQVTADDGRVLAMAQSPDGKRLAYVRAGRLVRVKGRADVLRGLSLRTLELSGMVVGPAVEIPGDVRKLGLCFTGGGEAVVSVLGSHHGPSRFRLADHELEPAPAERLAACGAPTTILTGAGVAPATRKVDRPGCPFTVRDEPAQALGSQVRVLAGRKRSFVLDAAHGAGLRGMPFPR